MANIDQIIANLGAAQPRPQSRSRSSSSGDWSDADFKKITSALSAKPKRKTKQGAKGPSGPFSPVLSALELTDVPGSWVRSHIADVAGNVADRDVLGSLEAVGHTINPVEVAGQLAQGGLEAFGAKGRLADAKWAYADNERARDYAQHTGAGTYLQRFINSNDLQDTPLNNAALKIGLGFAGDVATDPLTYLTGGTVKIAQGSAKGAARKLLSQGVERATAKAVAEAGGEALDDAARAAIRKGVEGEAADAVGRISKKGLSSLGDDELARWFGEGVSGGLKFRVPGTGRWGQKILGTEEKLIDVLPKSVTEKVTRPLAAARSKVRGSGDNWWATHMSGANPSLARAWKSGEGGRIASALKAEDIFRTGSARREAGLRLSEGARVGGADVGGKGATEVFVKHVRNALKENPEAAIRAVESGDTAGVAGAQELQDFLHALYGEAEKAGLDINELDQYFPRMLTEEGRAARFPSGGGSYARSGGKAGFEHGRVIDAEKVGLDPETATAWDVRQKAEEWASENLPGLKGDFFEKNPDKVLPAYVESLNARIAEVEQMNRLTDVGIVRRLQSPENLEAASDALDQQLVALMSDPNIGAPRDVAEVLNQVAKVRGADGMGKFLRQYDKMLAYVKAWQLATPGFHSRNFMGGMFNNYLAGIDVGAHTRFFFDHRKWLKGTLSPEKTSVMDELMPHLSSGMYGDEVAREAQSSLAGTYSKALGTNNPALRGSRKAGMSVEHLLRGALGYDRMLKGGSLDGAINDIVRYHFDYQDLSQFERGTIKRINPYYTYLRKNFPLQLEMLAAKPGAYSKYWQAKQEIEAGVPVEENTPLYFTADLLGMRTGLRSPSGDQTWLTPDLPFTQTMVEGTPDFSQLSASPAGLAHVFDNYASTVNPLLKTPLERLTGRQFFKGIPLDDEYQDMPDAWGKIPGLTQVLEQAGMAQDGKIKGRDAYTIEQFLPWLGRMRRLIPGDDKKMQARALTNWASFFGMPVRSLTEAEKRGEKNRKKYAGADTIVLNIPQGRKDPWVFGKNPHGKSKKETDLFPAGYGSSSSKDSLFPAEYKG